MVTSFTLGVDKPWRFVLADISFPIIGIDYLRHYKLVLNFDDETLTDPNTNKSIKGHPSLHSANTTFTPPTFTNAFDEILRDFPQLLDRTNKTPKINHGIEHHIVTTGPPVFAKARRYHSDKYN